MTTLPKCIKVGPHSYSVKIHPAREMGDNLGDTDLDALEIRLRWGLKPSKKREVLWHELLHCCADIAKITEAKNEEDWITAMSPIEFQVLQENPQLVKFLTRDK